MTVPVTSTTLPMGSAPALSIGGLTKSFGATLALDAADLSVRPGTVHALLGRNGSGKSTVIKVLAGVHPADSGTLSVGGTSFDLGSWDARAARDAGLRFVHQDLGLFDGMSIAENFAAAAGYPTRAGGRVDWPALRDRVTAMLHDYELDVDPTTPINALRPADRTMVAIARALQDQTSNEQILLLDEPTASLAQHESDLLLHKVRRRAELGQTIVIVSHRMTEVLSVAHDFTVFRDGRTVATLADASPTEEELVQLMAGRAVDSLRPVAATRQETDTVLQVEGLTGGPLVGVDLTAQRGEIVGIAGLVGSGRSTLLRMLFGDFPSSAGQVALDGRPYQPRSVSEAMRHGVALVPEDRGRDAAFVDLPIMENLSVTRLRELWSAKGMNRAAERSTARTLIDDFGIKAAGPNAPLGSLSGGNQQKVVIARWLQREPSLLLLDEPTQGVDVMSRVDIYRTVRDAASRGATVLVASSDASELLALCDRVVILRGGRADEELATNGLDPDHLTQTLLRSSSSIRRTT
jgi:ribose transport system ATP-binding protein